MTTIRLGVLTSVVVLFGCAPGATSPDQWRLTTGQAVRSLGAGGEPTVVLVLEPATCFTCTVVLSEWLEWKRANPDRFRIVFTRRPTEAERKMLRTVRLSVAGVLDPDWAPSAQLTPMELVLRDSRVVYADSSLAGRATSRLLQAVWQGSLGTFLGAGKLSHDSTDP